MFFKKVFIAILIFTTLIKADTITISSGEWEPWISENLKNNGVILDIVDKILKSQDIDTKIIFYPWARAYSLAKQGKVDATAVWFKTEDREKDFLFSDMIFDTQDVLIYKKGKVIKFNNLEDLKNYKIAVVRSYSYGDKIDKMIKDKQIKVKVVNSDLLALKQIIKRDNFDVFICAKSVAKALILDNFTAKEADQFVFHPKATLLKPLFFLVSKKTKDAKLFLSAFNKGLKKFKQKGLVKKMINDSYSGLYK